MGKGQPNFRRALEQMLEYIKKHRICIGEAMFVLSDDVLLKKQLITMTLEEIDCIQFLGNLNHKTGARYQRAYGNDFVSHLHDRAVRKGIECPWGHKLWVVNTVRADQVNPELVLSNHLYEKVVKIYGNDPQIRAKDEDEQNSGYPPWRADPA